MPKKIKINLEEWKNQISWVEKPLDLTKDGEVRWNNYKTRLGELIDREFGKRKEDILQQSIENILDLYIKSLITKVYNGNFSNGNLQKDIHKQQALIFQMLVEGKHTKEFAEKVEIIHQVGLQAEEEKKDEFDLDEHPELKERTTSRKSRPSHVKTISRDEFVEITEGEEEIRPPRAPVPVVNSPQNQPKLSPTEKQLVVLVQKNEKLEEENEKLKRETGKLQNLLRIKELAEEILELEESISWNKKTIEDNIRVWERLKREGVYERMVKAGKIESEEAYFNSLLESKKIMEDDVKENEEKKARLEEELAILQAKAQELQSHIVINPQ